jgi:endosialidase-like protein
VKRLLLAALLALAVPASAQTVSNGGSDCTTNCTFTTPVLSGLVTGTYTLGGTPTIASPAITGTTSGTYTLGGTPTLSAGTLSGITTLPGSGNSIDASGDVIGTYFKPTGAIAASGPSIYSNGGQLAIGVNGTNLANYTAASADVLVTGANSDVTAYVLNSAAAGNTAARSILYIGNTSHNNAQTQDGQIIVNGPSTVTGNGARSVTINANAGVLDLATGGTNAITISTGQAVGLPGLASSSAAQTGTVCWTTGGGNLTVDTTAACLVSSMRFKMNDRPLDIGLDAVMKLRPVRYELRPEFNPSHLGEQVGLIAEDVASVDDRLIAHDPDGEARAVRYQQLTAVLVLAIQQQQAQIAALQGCRLRVAGHCWF